MRVKCQIKLVDRNAVQKGIAGPDKKSAQAVLFLARKPGNVIYLVHCTTKDRNGVKYIVKDNVMKIFPRYLDEGKTTIQLKTPQVDIFVSKANPQQLKLLVQSIKQAHCGILTDIGVLSSFLPAKLKHLQKQSVKLVISSRSEYPLTSDFPRTLQELSTSNCSLVRFDSRIFSLNFLSILNLSCNKIKVIPENLSQMNQLSLLDLSQNEISTFPKSLCHNDSKLCHSLKFLNLSKNSLVTLPETFCNLSALQDLSLSHNQLRRLPRDLERLKKLQNIHAASNCIKYLPGSLLNMRNLDKVDFFMNPLLPFSFVEEYNQIVKHLDVRSLQGLCAETIKSMKIPYCNLNFIPYPLVRYLNNAVKCSCGAYCFEESANYFIFYDLRSICENVTSLNDMGGYKAVFLVPICSQACKPTLTS